MVMSGSDMLRTAKQKLRLPRACRLYRQGVVEGNACSGDCTVYVSCGEEYQGPQQPPMAPVKVIGTNIEPEAQKELSKLATLPGVTAVFGMPDLHSGPTGCSVVTQDCIYPHLAGGDVGCGIALYRAGTSRHFKPACVVGRVKNMEPLHPDHIRRVLGRGELSGDDKLLGTIGAGNHFAEFMAVDKVMDAGRLQRLGVGLDETVLCVHSGSRHFGKSIFDSFGSACLVADKMEEYMEQHDRAVAWAVLNRRTIACRVLNTTEPELVLDVSHNSITRIEGSQAYVHRKGAAPTDRGVVLIPGSRGTASFLVDPRHSSVAESGQSVAHGAGRRLTRAKAHAKSLKRHGPDLRALRDGTVHCSSAQLLAEESPEAYKDIDGVIEDLSQLVTVVARLRPLLTIKDFGPGSA